MKLETYVNAMEKARYDVQWRHTFQLVTRRKRQYYAFRSRILRMNAEKDDLLEQWAIYHGFYMSDIEMIETITEKDARIAELKAENQAMEYLLNEGENIGVE